MTFLKVLEGLRTPFLDKLMLGITYLGDEVALFLFAAIILWCVDKRKGYRICTACFSALALTSLLKGLFMVARPWVRDPSLTTVDGAAGTAEDFSFPSGHSATAASAYGSIASYFGGKVFKFLLLLLPLAVGFTRMYLGVHTPQDVAVGLIIGYGFAFGVPPLLEKLEARSVSALKIDLFVTLCSAVIVIVLALRLRDPSLTEVQAACMQACVKDGCTLLGAALGLTLGRRIEEKHIRFDPRATLPAQVIKVALGLALTMGIRVVLKALFNALMPGSMVLQVLRYFLLVMFLLCVWPLAFPTINRLCGKD